MKIPSKYNKPLSIDQLVSGIMACYDNYIRLFEDGKILFEEKRFLSCISVARLAAEELIKSHLLFQGATYKDDEVEQWQWMWRSFSDHREKLRILEYEFHWKYYGDEENAKEKFNKIINLLIEQREMAIYVAYDSKKEIFLSPENYFKNKGFELEKYAKNELAYLENLARIFFVGGKPTIEQLKLILSNVKK